MLASRSASESESSANAGSRVSRGKFDGMLDDVGVVVDARREVRLTGRKGVVGREGIL